MKKIFLICSIFLTSNLYPLSSQEISQTICDVSLVACKNFLPSLLVTHGFYTTNRSPNKASTKQALLTATCVSACTIIAQLQSTKYLKSRWTQQVNTLLAVMAPLITTYLIQDQDKPHKILRNFLTLIANSLEDIANRLP